MRNGCSHSGTPAVCVNSCRVVAGVQLSFAGMSRYARRYSLAGASSSIRPCSQSCITATAVKVFVMEPILKTVSSVTGMADSVFAVP